MTYPQIDPDIIWAIIELASSPESLDDAPYPPEFIKLLKTQANKDRVHNNTLDDLETEVAIIKTEADDLGARMDDETKEETVGAYLKLKAVLITKLVDIKERIYNMKKMKEFQDRVLMAMDTILTAEQRTQFMELLSK